MGRVDGKVVLITGGASGQGAAEAAALAAEGATVIAADIQEPLETPPAGVTYRRLDIGSQEDWLQTAAWVKAEHGVAHGLVNNAGVVLRDRVRDISLEDWDRVLRINLTGALLGMQAIAPLMTDGGSIVNVSSRAGLSGHFPVAYTTSKWALRGLSRVATLCLFPGYIDTPMVRTASPTFKERSIAEIPIGRLGTVEDIAPLVVFLMSDESTYITGAEISVDGGEQSHGGTKIYSDLARGA
jgi:3alpha(or 20beta)-hydroxysteroid dehydrogenase